jgi:hypothetical protein
MIRKTLKFSLIAIVAMGMVACGQKKSNLSEKEFIRALSCYEQDKCMSVDSVIKLIENNPQSIDFDLTALNAVEDEYGFQHILIHTSDDGNIRIYDVGDDSTDFIHLLQYRSSGAFTEDFEGYSYCKIILLASEFGYDTYSFDYKNTCSDGYTTDAIYTIDNYYLLVFSERVSNRYSVSVTQKVIAIDENIEKAPIFKTRQRNIDEMSIQFEDYDYSDIEITYNSVDQKLYIPLIDEEESFTDKNLVYQWKEDHFEYIGTKSVLHSSIENYKRKERIFETERFRIKIDQMNNGKYRYASWSKDKIMADKPDLIIENGIKECWSEEGKCDCNSTYDSGDSAVLGRKYTFKSGEYKYIYINGWWKGQTVDELTVEKNGKEILREEIE